MIVVVGGGILGVALLDALAERGTPATLLERGRLGDGATGHSGGMIRLWHIDPWQIEQTRRSWAYWQALPFHQTGALYFETERPDVGFLRDYEVEWVEPEAGRQRFPDFVWDDVPGAVYEPQAGWFETRSTLTLLAERAVARGAQVREHAEVTDVVVRDDRVVGVTAQGVNLRADAVVWAGGPSSLDPVSTLTDLPPSENRAIQMIRLDLPRTLPCLLDRRARCFARSLPGGSTWVGVGLDAPDGDSLREEDAEKALAALQARWLPARGACWGEGVRVADRYTPSRRPHLGPSLLPGLFWALGGSGACWKYAPAVTADLAEQLLAVPQ